MASENFCRRKAAAVRCCMHANRPRRCVHGARSSKTGCSASLVSIIGSSMWLLAPLQCAASGLADVPLSARSLSENTTNIASRSTSISAGRQFRFWARSSLVLNPEQLSRTLSRNLGFWSLLILLLFIAVLVDRRAGILDTKPAAQLLDILTSTRRLDGTVPSHTHFDPDKIVRLTCLNGWTGGGGSSEQ